VNCVQLIKPVHQRKFLSIGLHGFVVQTRPIYASGSHCRHIDGSLFASTSVRRVFNSIDRARVTKNPEPPSALRSSRTQMHTDAVPHND
jgi:hypothetical protein